MISEKSQKKKNQNALAYRLPKNPRNFIFLQGSGGTGFLPAIPRKGCSSRRVLWGRASAAREGSLARGASGRLGPRAGSSDWPMAARVGNAPERSPNQEGNEQPRGQLPGCRSCVLAPRTQSSSRASPCGLGSPQVLFPSSPHRAVLTSALAALPPSAFWASAPQQLP